MNKKDRWTYLTDLDEELLKGGVVLSEWCCFIVREADNAFAEGANLASILTAVSGIETYLRAEYPSSKGNTLFTLIKESPLDENLKKNINQLRKYRNTWVHVEEPWEDEFLLNNPIEKEKELEKMAYFAARVLRKTIYKNPWI